MQNDYQGALDDFNKAFEIDSLYEGEYFKRGFSKYHLDDNLGAIEGYNRDLKNNPNSTGLYYFIARYQAKDFANAIEDFKKAIIANPNDGNAYEYRGMCKINLGLVEGCLDIIKAKKLGCTFAEGDFKLNCGYESDEGNDDYE